MTGDLLGALLCDAISSHTYFTHTEGCACALVAGADKGNSLELAKLMVACAPQNWAFSVTADCLFQLPFYSPNPIICEGRVC